MGDVSVNVSEQFDELWECVGTIKLLCKRLLQLCGSERSEFNLLICDDVAMTEFNRRHRGVDCTTDVLSFPAQSFPIENSGKWDDMIEYGRFLGDLAVSYPAIVRQGEATGTHWFEEMMFVTVHGFYHLLGFNHAVNGNHDSDVMLVTAARTTERLMSDAQLAGHLAQIPIGEQAEVHSVD